MNVIVKREVSDNDLVIKTFICSLTTAELRSLKDALTFYDRNKMAVINKQFVRTNQNMLRYFTGMETDHEV